MSRTMKRYLKMNKILEPEAEKFALEFGKRAGRPSHVITAHNVQKNIPCSCETL